MDIQIQIHPLIALAALLDCVISNWFRVNGSMVKPLFVEAGEMIHYFLVPSGCLFIFKIADRYMPKMT